MNITASYDSTVPIEAQQAFNSLISLYDSAFINPINVNLKVTFGATGLGSSLTQRVAVFYSDWVSHLQASALANPGDIYEAAAVKSLPPSDPLGDGTVYLNTANARALGITQAEVGGTLNPVYDSVLTFSNQPGIFEWNQTPNAGLYDFIDVAAHELNEALGVGSVLTNVPNYGAITSPSFEAEDYFRYWNGLQLRAITTDPNANVSFSYNGGLTDVAQFNQDGSFDRNDWISSLPYVQDATLGRGQVRPILFSSGLTPETIVLSTLGYIRLENRVVLDAAGATDLVQLDSNYFVFSHGTSSGPALSFNNMPITAGQFGAGWAPIGAEQMGGGYEVAWKLAGSNSYTIWTTDNNGNYVGTAVPMVSGASLALESAETSFQQDLNGDGTIGPTRTVIDALGGTDLVQLADTYFLYVHNTSSGPALKFNGAPVTFGEFAGWAPIGAETTGSGYEVAWKSGSSYSIWNTDGNGNYVSSPLGLMASNSAALEVAEVSFQQDLNGDGSIGPIRTVIEAVGGTDLVQLGNAYFLYTHSTSTGPQLMFNGAPVTVGEFAGWAPIGAEQMSGGYEVAWKLASSNSYSIWNTDSDGNYLSSPLGLMASNSAGLESAETSFQQDLNGDGVTGLNLPKTVIEAVGSTDLVQAGGNYFLFAHGTSSGPGLTFNGAPVMAGQFGAWMPVGAEATGSGYEVAWKAGSSYSIWNTDGNGNYVSSPLGLMASNSPALESAETGFQQDLNGDGVIGLNLPKTVIEGFGSTDLAQVGSNYFLFAHGTSSGPLLTFNGAPVTAGQFGTWMPIGAEPMGSGYEVAWKSGNNYSIWNTDSNGNYLSSPLGLMAGNSAALESAETSFQQDLNGDGVIGVPQSVGGAGGVVITVVANRLPIVLTIGMTIGSGQTAQISSPFSGEAVFTGSSGTLLLNPSSEFTGTVVGMSGQNTIDISDINFTTPQAPSYSGTSSGGTLTVSDGSHAANIALLGNYLASTFVAASDGHGGTSVIQVPNQASANDSITHAQT